MADRPQNAVDVPADARVRRDNQQLRSRPHAMLRVPPRPHGETVARPRRHLSFRARARIARRARSPRC